VPSCGTAGSRRHVDCSSPECRVRLLHLQLVLSLRPFLTRLIAITIAVVAAGAGAPARAPHALRVWADSAAEVTSAARAVPLRGQGARQLTPALALAKISPARDGHVACLDESDSDPTAAAGASGTLGWPTASSGRDVVTRKRSLLI
jgi:hypothetical protein